MGPGLIEVEFLMEELDDIQMLWAHLAISALRAGYHVTEVNIGIRSPIYSKNKVPILLL